MIVVSVELIIMDSADIASLESEHARKQQQTRLGWEAAVREW